MLALGKCTPAAVTFEDTGGVVKTRIDSDGTPGGMLRLLPEVANGGTLRLGTSTRPWNVFDVQAGAFTVTAPVGGVVLSGPTNQLNLGPTNVFLTGAGQLSISTSGGAVSLGASTGVAFSAPALRFVSGNPLSISSNMNGTVSGATCTIPIAGKVTVQDGNGNFLGFIPIVLTGQFS